MRNETFNTDINYVPYVLCVEHLVMWCKTGSRKIDAYHQKESHDEERHSYRYSAKSYRIESDRIGPDRMKFDVEVIKLFDIFERIFVEITGLTDDWKKLSFSEQSTAIRSHFSVHLTHSHTRLHTHCHYFLQLAESLRISFDFHRIMYHMSIRCQFNHLETDRQKESEKEKERTREWNENV